MLGFFPLPLVGWCLCGIAHGEHHTLLVFRAAQGQPALRIPAMAGAKTPDRPRSES